MDIYCGGWIFFGWVHEMDANCVEKGRGPNLGGDIVINAALFTCRVTPTYAIASVLKLNLLILSTTITSFTAVVDDNYLNLWLNWKFEAKKLKLSGYSRRGYNGWEFAQQATDIIKEYITRFIQQFMAIRGSQDGDRYSDMDLCDQWESRAKLNEILDLSKGIQGRSFEKVALEAQQPAGGHVCERLSQLLVNSCGNRRARSCGAPRAFPAKHF